MSERFGGGGAAAEEEASAADVDVWRAAGAGERRRAGVSNRREGRTRSDMVTSASGRGAGG